MRYDNIAIFLIDFNNAEFHCFANEYIVVADRLNINLRTREECLCAKHVNNHAAFGFALDEALNNLLVVESLIDTLPAASSTSLLVREDELSVLVFLILDVNLYFVADLEFGIVAELGSRNNAVGLVSDTDNNVTFVDSLNCTFHYFAGLDGVEGFVVLIDQFFVLFALSFSFKGIPVEVLERKIFCHCGRIDW